MCLNCQVLGGLCGDGVVERGEACDDGNRDDGDECAADCSAITWPNICGDGLRGPAEYCDPGDEPGLDYSVDYVASCSTTCDWVTSYCGDTRIDSDHGEACDDGNRDAGDYCAADCSAVTGYCGDGITQINEDCDDAGVPGGCSDTCTSVPDGFVRIEAGSFVMGAPTDEATSDSDSEPQHSVTLTHPFYMSASEVTRGSGVQ